MKLLGALRSRVGLAGTVAICFLAVLLLLQAVPYGRSHADPRPTQSARFATARGEQLFAQACGDCHSDRTRWPWYSNIAPMSWLVQHDVDEGRGIFNVSEWDRPQPDLGEIVQQISGGGMPPWQYTLIHADAKLSKSERADLVATISALYRNDPPPVGGR